MAVVNPIDLINNLEDAKNLLRDYNNAGVVLSEGQLQQIIGKMDGKVPGSQTTLLYSGDITIGKNPDGSAIKIQSWQAAEAVGKNSGGKIATMGQADIGKLLADSNFRQAVINTANSIGIHPNTLLFGQDANGNRINSNSLSDVASERFISQIEGKVQIMAGDISPNSIFAKTEFPEVISNNKITDVDGISKTDIDVRFGELIHSGNTFDDAVNNIRVDITQQSKVNTETNIKLIKPDGPNSHVAGIDTRDFFGRTGDVPHVNTIPSSATNVVSLADSFDGAKLNGAINHLGKLGTAGDVLAVTIAVFKANEAYAAGDTAGAAYIMSEWAAEFVGGIGGGIGLVKLAGLLTKFFPPTAVISWVITIGAAVTGSVAGGEAAKWLLEKVTELGISTISTLQEIAEKIDAIWPGFSDSLLELSDTLSHAYEAFLHAVKIALQIDPLIIDLNNNGIALDSWQTSNALFDLNGDGVKENTGWTKANGDDAYLVIDKNNDGKINDITEMFGNASTPGFAELANYDSNKDGVINATDTQFNLLKLWNDKNANGVVDAGELTTLAQNNIKEISLGAYGKYANINGNLQSRISTITKTDGTTRNIHELAFGFETPTIFSNPDSTLPANFQLSIAAIMLPYSRGYGSVYSWQAAMTLDPTLLAMAQDMMTLTPANDNNSLININYLLTA